MSVKKNFYFIHGFLGDNNYFSKMIETLKQKPDTGNIHTYSLFSKDIESKLSSKNSFLDWATYFNSIVKATSENNILVAYSMGGRLGVHAFLSEPELWNEVHLISSNPGILKSTQRMVRMAWEDGWCYQIDNKPWKEFIKLWNAQDIFKYDQEMVTEESLFCKKSLKLALKNWSLTKHKVDLKQLSNDKLNWYVGEKDSKYLQIYKQLKQVYNIKNIHTIEGQGHRINEIPI